MVMDAVEHNRGLDPDDEGLLEMVRDHPLQVVHAADSDVSDEIEMTRDQKNAPHLHQGRGPP